MDLRGSHIFNSSKSGMMGYSMRDKNSPITDQPENACRTNFDELDDDSNMKSDHLGDGDEKCSIGMNDSSSSGMNDSSSSKLKSVHFGDVNEDHTRGLNDSTSKSVHFELQ